ncbi:hypothetical protein LOAG_11344, partial [Loa loa]
MSSEPVGWFRLVLTESIWPRVPRNQTGRTSPLDVNCNNGLIGRRITVGSAQKETGIPRSIKGTVQRHQRSIFKTVASEKNECIVAETVHIAIFQKGQVFDIMVHYTWDGKRSEKEVSSSSDGEL